MYFVNPQLMAAQVISGAQDAALDVDDLQRHVQVSNCSGPKAPFFEDALQTFQKVPESPS